MFNYLCVYVLQFSLESLLLFQSLNCQPVNTFKNTNIVGKVSRNRINMAALVDRSYAMYWCKFRTY